MGRIHIQVSPVGYDGTFAQEQYGYHQGVSIGGSNSDGSVVFGFHIPEAANSLVSAKVQAIPLNADDLWCQAYSAQAGDGADAAPAQTNGAEQTIPVQEGHRLDIDVSDSFTFRPGDQVALVLGRGGPQTAGTTQRPLLLNLSLVFGS